MNKPKELLFILNDKYVYFSFHYMSNEELDSIYIMEKQGDAFLHIYQFHDDPSIIYLESLSVSEHMRRKKRGRKLLRIGEQIGKLVSATSICLWVKKDTWMHDWYIRFGYVDWVEHSAEKNAIWMKKSLV